MKPQVTDIFCGLLLILAPFAGNSQPAIEFASGSGPSGNGSVITNQVITFQTNMFNPATGTYSPFSPTTTATFAISNQQYVLPATQNPNGGDISFGATNDPTGKVLGSAPTFPAMDWISAPSNTDFSATAANVGAGIAVNMNYAVEIFTSTMGLFNAHAATNGRYYMGDLTITLNIPITNPVLHVVGLGGTYNALGFTTELQLVTTGITLSELSGSKELNVTPTAILNSASAPTATTGAGAASGSILVTGSSVTSLHFQIYMRGNGKTPTWSNGLEHTGDAWLIGVSAQNTLVELPVGISSFTARPGQRAVSLQWTTASEQNSSYFDIQRSSTGTSWTTIGRVPSAGNSDKPMQYEFVDNGPNSGANFYRLAEEDENQGLVYSPVRNVDFSGLSASINWYPNPVHDRLTITSNAIIRSATLITADGRILREFDEFSSGQSLDLSSYPFGIYFLMIRTADGASQTARIERD
ncbi:MAG TPA: T9SS type A sorting domain-containing protein [Puia sp.]|nr:T9SS type A sorting domain-containing protein [Puia sp.]